MSWTVDSISHIHSYFDTSHIAVLDPQKGDRPQIVLRVLLGLNVKDCTTVHGMGNWQQHGFLLLQIGVCSTSSIEKYHITTIVLTGCSK